MANDLVTLSGITYAASSNAAFGQVLSAGSGVAAGPIIPALPCTIEAWVTTTATATGKRVAAGQYFVGWIGCNGAYATASYGSSNIEILSTIAINDGLRHHLELVLDATEARFYVDGVLAGSATATYTFDFVNRKFAVRGLNFAAASTAVTNPWSTGTVDEVAVWNSAKRSANFTPPTAPYTDGSAGLIALYHFENSVLDTATATAPAATAGTLSGPTTGVVGTASSAFTVGANGSITGTVTVTPDDGGQGGTFNPASVSISSATPTATFTYTAASTGAKTISATNNGSLSNPAAITYTASATATAPDAPTIGTAVAGDGYVDVHFTAGSDGGSAILDFTATLSTGETATGTSSPIRVPAANGTARTGSVVARNAIDTSASSAQSNSVTPVAAIVNAYDIAKIVFSPYNWDATTTRAKTVNTGAYFRTIFGGPSCTLNFDMSATKAPYTKLMYRVDGTGPWITVDLAASIVITVPSETAEYATHYLEVRVKATAMSTTYSIWPAVSAAAVILTGVILASGKVLTLPVARPLRALVYGDSITVGYRSLNGGESTISSDSSQTGAYVACEAMNAEFGIVAFSGHGWLDTGYGSVPGMDVTYNQLWDGMPRSFTPAPDFILINQGTNDGSTDVTTTVTAILNALLAATPASTKIILLRPYGGATAASITAGIAASTAPGRCYYINTAGWYRSANSNDGLHPYGIEHITRLAPLTVDAIRSTLASAPTLATRTVSLTLGDASGALADLTDLQVSFFDEPTPDLHTTARFKTAGETTDASGVLTFTVQSTLAVGATGSVVVRLPDGRNLVRSVVVA